MNKNQNLTKKLKQKQKKIKTKLMRNGFCVYDNMSTSHCLLDETQRPFQLEPWPSETKERPSLFCLFLSTKPTSSFFVGDPKFDSSIKKKKKREREREKKKKK